MVVKRRNGSLVEHFDDVTVDPETLSVQVRLDETGCATPPSFRKARRSRFLLLRVALTEHLTKAGESAPLILDEVTAQCDSVRRTALLEMLLEMSAKSTGHPFHS